MRRLKILVGSLLFLMVLGAFVPVSHVKADYPALVPFGEGTPIATQVGQASSGNVWIQNFTVPYYYNGWYCQGLFFWVASFYSSCNVKLILVNCSTGVIIATCNTTQSVNNAGQWVELFFSSPVVVEYGDVFGVGVITDGSFMWAYGSDVTYSYYRGVGESFSSPQSPVAGFAASAAGAYTGDHVWCGGMLLSYMAVNIPSQSGTGTSGGGYSTVGVNSGYVSDGVGNAGASDDQLLLCNFVTPSNVVGISSLSFYTNVTTGYGTFHAKGIVYGDGGSVFAGPYGSPVAVSAEVTVSSATSAWVNFTFNHEVLAPNTVYWFGLITDGDFFFSYDASTGHYVYAVQEAVNYAAPLVLTGGTAHNSLNNYVVSESFVFDVYVAPSPSASGSSYVAPTPTAAGSWTTGLSNYTDLIVAFFIILVPPLLVVVAVPKVGMAGFATMFTATVCIGVFTLGMPFYFLILMAMMDVVMFYSMIQRG